MCHKGSFGGEKACMVDRICGRGIKRSRDGPAAKGTWMSHF